MSVINSNILSLVTQNNLTKSQGAMNTAVERLSSGMRINSAKDDAAGQAIANRFTASIKGLTQASRNANDGISLAQTTEGALNEVNNNLQRIRELTVQSANGSNSVADKASMQAEIIQRLAEIDRTSAQTDFNGTKVLGSTQSLSIQVGAKDNETISIGLQKTDSAALSMRTFSVSGPDGTGTSSAATFAAFTGTTAVATTAVAIATTPAGATGVSDLGSGATAVMSAAAVMDSKGNYFAEFTVGTAPTRAGLLAGDKLYVAIAPSSIVVTAGTPDTATVAAVDFTNATFAKSTNALATVDTALAKIDMQRGALGAVQNRFDSVIANLGTSIVNQTASRSRIEDADYATEVSNMTRAQILQQAGTSVLAKSNSSTEGVLSLLR
jgi:flagellin